MERERDKEGDGLIDMPWVAIYSSRLYLVIYVCVYIYIGDWSIANVVNLSLSLQQIVTVQSHIKIIPHQQLCCILVLYGLKNV